MRFNKKGQGESLIKLLVIAIIAIIALALAKSYFRESARVTQRTVEEVFNPEGAIILPGIAIIPAATEPHYQDEK
jgi:hypothetical protein